jgi:hypothetical protein
MARIAAEPTVGVLPGDPCVKLGKLERCRQRLFSKARPRVARRPATNRLNLRATPQFLLQFKPSGLSWMVPHRRAAE